ncbi:MAG: hypothetical protein ACTSYM_10240 [Candidatus Baldrarchaeia archaeon]
MLEARLVLKRHQIGVLKTLHLYEAEKYVDVLFPKIEDEYVRAVLIDI